MCLHLSYILASILHAYIHRYMMHATTYANYGDRLIFNNIISIKT